MTRLARLWFLVPALWLLTAIAVMRPGCLEYRFNVQVGTLTINMWQFGAAVYDSADITAFALRGANASPFRIMRPWSGKPTRILFIREAPCRNSTT